MTASVGIKSWIIHNLMSYHSINHW